VSWSQVVVLAVIQGLTEFLPISSTSHLALVPLLTKWPEHGLPLSLAVQAGGLLAATVYFAADLWAMASGMVRFARGRRDPGAILALQIVVATVPAVAAAWAFETYVDDTLETIKIIGWATVGFGILLYVADRACLTVRKVEHATFGDAIFIGFAQALALVPGASRSGITITAARILGYERDEAARFSFLMAVPALVASIVWLGLKFSQTSDTLMTREAAAAMIVSFAAGLVAIAVLMSWLRRSTYTAFVVYRLLLGAAMLAFAYHLT